jgi:hypothetical protein
MNIDVCPDTLRYELLNFEAKYQLTPVNRFLPLDLLYYNMNLALPTLLLLALLVSAWSMLELSDSTASLLDRTRKAAASFPSASRISGMEKAT